METAAQLSLGVVAGLIAFATVVVARQGLASQRRLEASEFRRAGTAVLEGLTTGEVAAARDVLGTLRYGDPAQIARLDRPEVIRAYYTITWALERAALGRVQVREVGAARPEIVHELDRSLRWHTVELVTNLALVRSVFADISDEDAWSALAGHAERLGVDAASVAGDLSPSEVERLAGRATALGHGEESTGDLAGV